MLILTAFVSPNCLTLLGAYLFIKYSQSYYLDGNLNLWVGSYFGGDYGPLVQGGKAYFGDADRGLVCGLRSQLAVRVI